MKKKQISKNQENKKKSNNKMVEHVFFIIFAGFPMEKENN